MDIPLDLFEKPIQRIKATCDLMGISDEFERKLPELETIWRAGCQGRDRRRTFGYQRHEISQASLKQPADSPAIRSLAVAGAEIRRQPDLTNWVRESS